MRASHLPAIRSIVAAFVLALAALFAARADAQRPANHIAVELVAEGAAPPGGTVDLAIAMVPEEGWHGYWSNPGDAGYGMELDWSLPQGWNAGEPQYPVPQTLLISGLMNHVYEGPYAVLVPVSVPADAVPGTRVPVTIDAQWLACTNEICVPEQGTLAAVLTVGSGDARDPRFDAWRAALAPLLDREGTFQLTDEALRIAIPLPASFSVSAPHLFLANQGLVDYAASQTFLRNGDTLVVELQRSAGDAAAPEAVSGILKLDDAGGGIRFQARQGTVPAGGERLEFGEDAAPAPLWSLLLAALAGGLLLNIMPCVFPILSLKALSLARAGESEGRARAEGLAYTAGVILSCIVLGAMMLILRAAGNQIGWAFQLQEPGVVVALLFLAAAITANFAGLFELPSLSFGAGGPPAGAFGTGVLAAFVATPCTGPFMAAAMGAALLLPAPAALSLFAALGLGLALPFLLLGFVPPLRRLLPKPGRWMETFRKLMAIPMGLTALALLWLAWRLGGGAFAIAAGALTLALLIGLREAGRQQRRGNSALGPIAISLVAVIGVGALLLPQLQSAKAAASEAGVIDSRPFSEGALAEARASGKPVFVWFTADWCLTCKVNEGVAIEREATRSAFERAGVVALRGDWTRRDPAITRFLTAHGAAGVPFYLWYPPNGEPQQMPQVLTPDSLVQLAETS